MFNFLKKLFSGPGEEETPKEKISVEELENWFKGKSDKILSELDVKITDIKNKVKEEVMKTKDNLAILSVAKLHNPKITIKENQFMEGNRESYVLSVNNFLRGVDLEKEDYSALLQFCDNFNLRLERFGKSTIRPYHILQEFFAHESRDIAINIKNLDSLIHELRRTIEAANLDKVNDIRGSIIELNNKIKQKERFEKIIKEKNEIREGLIRNRDEIEKETERLIKSGEYKQLNELKANKEAALASIREHNAKVVHAFSVMERPLKKLNRIVIEDSELLGMYIENPVKTLVSDNSLKIVGLLKKLEHNLNNLTLELKDKKREKVLETVKGLTGEFLREFVNKHDELNKALENLEKEIKENGALKEENKLRYELSNVTDNLEKVNTEILGNEQELSKINIEETKNKLEEEINKLLGVDVVIS